MSKQHSDNESSSTNRKMIITDHPEVDWVATSFHWTTTTISWFNNLAPLSVKTVWLKVKCFGKTLISVQPVKAAARERLELLIFLEISNQTDHLACELWRRNTNVRALWRTASHFHS